MSKLDEILRSKGVLRATPATPATQPAAIPTEVAGVATVARSSQPDAIPQATYTRCTDCRHYAAPPPDTAFWCPLVKGHPTVALWAICTGYVAKPGTPPGPTVPPEWPK